MKPLSEQDHYEALEIPRDASPEDVERAWRLAQATYSEDSLAGHSVFDEGDAAVIRERLELAYRTLIDPQTRAAYDAELRASDEGEPEHPFEDPAVIEQELPRAAAPSDSLGLDELEDDEEGAEYDGARLRRSRLRGGIELDQIAKVTKVSPTYLQFLEEERFESLPAAVYVRGFVMGYASCVGLEPQRVARSYMKRYEERRSAPRKGLFSRR